MMFIIPVASVCVVPPRPMVLEHIAFQEVVKVSLVPMLLVLLEH